MSNSPAEWKEWTSAPRDGTPFAVSNIFAFEPGTGRLMALFFDPNTGETVWDLHYINTEPYWTTLPPLTKKDVREAVEEMLAKRDGSAA